MIRKMASSWNGFDHLRGVRTLVTGGAGFIGSHLAHALVELGSIVTVIDDLSGGGDPAQLPPAVKFVRASILDEPILADCMMGCAFVFHEGALGSVPRSIEAPRLYHEVNVTGTLNVLEAARKAGVKRVIFAASSSAYGDNPGLPKIETMPPRPLSPYAATKLAGEALLAAYAASYPLDTVSLRYFNIFGPRQNPESAYAAVIAAFAKAMLAGRRPIIYGDGEQTRDFTYVDNVVLANLLATKVNRHLGGAIINVACGRRVTINDLVVSMADLLGCPELKPIYEPARAGDVKDSLADLSAARAVLGYEPIVEYRDGLEITAKWYAGSLSGK
jgi:nucleoside-diphosphate-sugar epimerase